MNGQTPAEVLHLRFETIRRGELARLRKKVNGLSPEGQQVLEAVTLAIINALAARCAALGDADPAMLRHVGELFGASGAAEERRAGQPGCLIAAPTTP